MQAFLDCQTPTYVGILKTSTLDTLTLSVLQLSTNQWSLNVLLNRKLLTITWHTKTPTKTNDHTYDHINFNITLHFDVETWAWAMMSRKHWIRIKISFVHVIEYITTWCGPCVVQRVVLRIMPPWDKGHHTSIESKYGPQIATSKGWIRAPRSQNHSMVDICLLSPNAVRYPLENYTNYPN